MGEVSEMVISPVPSERLPLLCQAAPRTTYLSQEEVVHQASAAPWLGLRRALLCLLGGLFASMLAAAAVLLVTMPRLQLPLAWWQKSSFYHLPATYFPDSNSDGHGDLEGKREETRPSPCALPQMLTKEGPTESSSCWLSLPSPGVRQQLGQLQVLPIQALVLGPILEADGANLTRLCPAYGSLEQLRGLVDEGHEKGMCVCGMPRCGTCLGLSRSQAHHQPGCAGKGPWQQSPWQHMKLCPGGQESQQVRGPPPSSLAYRFPDTPAVTPGGSPQTGAGTEL